MLNSRKALFALGLKCQLARRRVSCTGMRALKRLAPGFVRFYRICFALAAWLTSARLQTIPEPFAMMISACQSHASRMPMRCESSPNFDSWIPSRDSRSLLANQIGLYEIFIEHFSVMRARGLQLETSTPKFGWAKAHFELANLEGRTAMQTRPHMSELISLINFINFMKSVNSILWKVHLLF